MFLRTYTVILLGGGGGNGFYSGEGSHTDIFVNPYCELIRNFLQKHPDIKTIVDLGCGDFNVASQFINDNVNYVGVDIVQDMINSHQKNYSSEHVKFLCLDIVDDELPDGDMCLIRQVLQHLSNKDIAKIFAHVKKYKYVLVTEHRTIKSKAKFFNVDLTTGSNTRGAFLSGVYPDEKPFNLKIGTLLQIPYDTAGTQELVTLLIKN